MASLFLRRLLRAIGSCNKSSTPFSLSKGRAFSQFPLSGKSRCLMGLRGCAYEDNSNSVCSPGLEKATFSFYQRYSSSVLTHNSSEGTFPPICCRPSMCWLLTGKWDVVIPVTDFHNENKGFMVLAGDVFDVPIRKDIIHRVGTHSTKTISEVSGTGRSLGGRRLIVFEDLEGPSHKTKNVVNYVQHMENVKKLLVVDGGPINEKLKLGTQNLHYFNVLPSIGLNVYSILLHDTLVMSRDA
ncbi:50S ribosomal protein L4, partial [Striga asiatica]